MIAEPTSGTVTTANAGALTFEIVVAGRATHASTAYAGVSAFDAYLPVHAALADLQRRRNARVDPLMAEYPVAYPLSVGRVACGDWASSVPDRLVAEGRLGVALDEDPADARAELEEAVADAAGADAWLRECPPTVAWTGGQFASGRYAGDGGRSARDAGAGARRRDRRAATARARRAVRQRPAPVRRGRRADPALRPRRGAAGPRPERGGRPSTSSSP